MKKSIKTKIRVCEVSKRQNFDFDGEAEHLIEVNVIKFTIVQKKAKPKYKLIFPHQKFSDGMDHFELNTTSQSIANLFPLGSECVILLIPDPEILQFTNSLNK